MLKLLLKCVPCVITAERDAAFVKYVRIFVADLETIARSPDRDEAKSRDFGEALELVCSAFDPAFQFPRHCRTDALVAARKAFGLARGAGVFLGEFCFMELNKIKNRQDRVGT